MRDKLKVSLFLLALLAPSVRAEVKNIGEMSCGIGGQVPEITLLMAVIAAFIGLVFVGFGLMKLKEHSNSGQPASRETIGLPIVMIIVGGLLATAATVQIVAGNTIFRPDSATAQSSSRGDANGDVLSSFRQGGCNGVSSGSGSNFPGL